MQITISGDKLLFKNDIVSLAANLPETKILLNSTISNTDKGARFMYLDIKDHFLATPVRDLEYIKVKHEYVLQDIHNRCNFQAKVTQDK